MKLDRLLRTVYDIGETEALPPSASGVEIESIHYDSRSVQPGGLFIAVKGVKTDGHLFINDALLRGASAVVTERRIDAVPDDIPQIVVKDSRKTLALAADAFYGAPSRKMTVIGITGTNGKTTTSYIIESILKEAGFNTGVIGTVNYRYNGKSFNNPVTTPESSDLIRILHDMEKEGVTHAVLEASSHAIDLHRVYTVAFDLGVFTNLSQDHLDYHVTMEEYWECKKSFFTRLLKTGPKKDAAKMVVNINDVHGKSLWEEKTLPGLSVGFSTIASLYTENLDFSLGGISGHLCFNGESRPFHSPLVGKHNAENILCAAGTGAALGVAPSVIIRGIQNLPFVPGRLEPVPNARGIHVFVDYAHTPDALENVLSAVSKLTDKRIICVFGCGGDRDRAKRPKMAAAVGKYARFAVLTSDNPRSEDPMDIINHALPGIEPLMKRIDVKKRIDGESRQTPAKDEKAFMVEADRREAIEIAVLNAEPGDAVIIAGKGHENYQVLKDKTIHFDDREEALNLIGGLQ